MQVKIRVSDMSALMSKHTSNSQCPLILRAQVFNYAVCRIDRNAIAVGKSSNITFRIMKESDDLATRSEHIAHGLNIVLKLRRTKQNLIRDFRLCRFASSLFEDMAKFSVIQQFFSFQNVKQEPSACYKSIGRGNFDSLCN